MLKVLIADDNPDTGSYLKKIIEELTDVTVVAIAHNGQEALTLSAFHSPQVIFMDIDMPEMNGMEAARRLFQTHPGINFVFCTAYPGYAIEAFELYSFDYILKPINEQRVKDTIQHLQKKLIREQQPIDKSPPVLLLETDIQRIFINPREIIYIENHKPKLLIKTEQEIYFARGKLETFEYKLGSLGFFRCHRGYLVNMRQVHKIVPYGHSFELVLRSGDSILLSRRREKALREKLECLRTI